MAEERRLVTVLFADVVESTELGGSLDPEDLRALLGAYYALAKDVIAHYGGTAEKFIGDAVMAVFGLPAAHGDDPQRALSAALEIRSRVQADLRLADRLRVRFGINTGEVVAVVDASAGDFLVTGDAVTVAARLQQSAQPWAILAGERTVHASGASFKFGPAIDVEAKGKPAGVRAAQLVGRDTGIVRMPTPFVGRAGDLAQLELLGRRALVERRPTVVSIIAPAGTGKTRLVEEFLGRLRGIAADARVVTGQCLPYGERLTYWPLRSILLQLLGVASDAAPDEIRVAIGRSLREADGSRERTAEILAATIGAGDGGEPPDRIALQTAWRSALHLAATRAPLVVVLEDLHWASDSLLELVESIEPRDAVPLLVVALTRPELLDRRPAWGGGRRDYTAMTLDPLAPGEIEALVRQLLTHGSARVVKQIVIRAEGNPFYAVELVRMLTDRARALTDPVALERALATLPDTVQAAVLERLDLLGPEERRVMQLGSVLGRSFTEAGIVALAHDVAPAVDAALELLLAKDLLRPAGGDSFAFRHMLINEVAYQTLARTERGRLHAAAARWLEQGAEGHTEALAELIAHHYREAVALSRTAIAPEPSPDMRAKAVLWLERAADVALKSAAHVEAVRHLRAATELADRDRLADLYERIGDAFVSGDAVEAYRHVLQVSRGDVNRSADRELRAIAGMLHVTLRSGGSAGGGLSHEEIAALREEGERLMSLDVSEAAMAQFLVAESFEPFAIARGDERAPTEPQLAKAEATATRALKMAVQLDDTKLRSAALDGLGSVLSLRGDHRGAREVARQRIAMGTALDLVERLDAYAVATWLSVWLGELDDAIATSAEGLTLVQPGQATSWTLHLVSWRALALMRRGRWDEALTAGERARVLWIEGGRTAAVFALHGFLAALAVAYARADGQLFARFREPLEEIGSRAQRAPLRRLEFLSDDEGQPDHYLRHFNRRQPEALELGIAFASDAGRPPAPRLLRRLAASDRMRLLPLLAAEVRRAQGLAERDARALAEAAASFDARRAVPSAARAHCEHALLVGDDVELRAGLATLVDLGDVTQRDRYQSRSRV